jgi:hypothetical protein
MLAFALYEGLDLLLNDSRRGTVKFHEACRAIACHSVPQREISLTGYSALDSAY